MKENFRKNVRENRVTFQFQIGEWVLVSRKNTPLDYKSKVKLKWTGPYCVVEIISNNVYGVENLFGKRQIVHGSRLWYYSGKDLEVTDELTRVFAHDFRDLEIEKIDGVVRKGSKFLLE